MKFEICVTVVLLMVGACSAEKLTDRIDRLEAMLAEFQPAMEMMKTVGLETVSKLNEIILFYDARSGTNTNQCLLLEVLRNGEGKNFMNEFPEIQLNDELEGLPMRALRAKIHVLKTQMLFVEGKSKTYTDIGRAQVGLLQRVIAVGRGAICPNHEFLCPENYLFNRQTRSGCYDEQITADLNYEHALAVCHSRDGHLPYITSENENKNITYSLQPGTSRGNYVNHCIWLGAKRNAEGVWKHHEEDLEYTKWKSEPTEDGGDCAYYCLMSNTWVQTPCDRQCRVLCETDPRT